MTVNSQQSTRIYYSDANGFNITGQFVFFYQLTNYQVRSPHRVAILADLSEIRM
ncbi:hypothetical protein [Microcoleus sp. LEGE 07076]|uniref:hypothetical protein n=1 Tax=Microcoleus sp. LEGE 07076 TaxID=915322 RepID=UPI0030DD5DEB